MIKNKIKFLDIEINNLSKKDFINLLINFGQNDLRKKKIFYVNAHCINIAKRNKEYRDVLQQADLLFADGMSVVWASRILGNPLKERINSTEVFDEFCINVIKHRMSIYLFGADKQIINNTVKKLHYKYPDLNIVGFHHGYCTFDENNRALEEINSLRPNFLIVGMGVPKQEIWIHSNLNKLEVNACWAVGSLFDYLGGKIIQPPLLIRKSGLEWLSRLFQEPKRLWWRYLIGNSIFIVLTLKEFLKNLLRCLH